MMTYIFQNKSAQVGSILMTLIRAVIAVMFILLLVFVGTRIYFIFFDTSVEQRSTVCFNEIADGIVALSKANDTNKCYIAGCSVEPDLFITGFGDSGNAQGLGKNIDRPQSCPQGRSCIALCKEGTLWDDGRCVDRLRQLSDFPLVRTIRAAGGGLFYLEGDKYDGESVPPLTLYREGQGQSVDIRIAIESKPQDAPPCAGVAQPKQQLLKTKDPHSSRLQNKTLDTVKTLE